MLCRKSNMYTNLKYLNLTIFWYTFTKIITTDYSICNNNQYNTRKKTKYLGVIFLGIRLRPHLARRLVAK